MDAKLLAALSAALADGSKGTAASREGACAAVEAVMSVGQSAAEHQMTGLVGALVACCADKHSKEVQEASAAALGALAKTMSQHGLGTVMDALIAAMDPKVGRCRFTPG